MRQRVGSRWAVWAALAALGLAPAAPAGTPLLGFRQWDDPRVCPPSTYSPWHYITPAVDRVRAFCHPSLGYIYAKDRYPGVPLQFNPIPYCCISVPPDPFSVDHYYPGRRLPVPPLENCPCWPPGCCPPKPVEQAPGAASARPDAVPTQPGAQGGGDKH